MSFTFTAASLTTRDDRRRRPALTPGQIARTLLLLLACAAALAAMTRRGEAARFQGTQFQAAQSQGWTGSTPSRGA